MFYMWVVSIKHNGMPGVEHICNTSTGEVED